MQAGEFFVSLGVRGSEKTLGALTSITHGMNEAKSMSLETKAAIVGAVYAFEHMMAKSSQAGTDLTNFSLLTGQSAVELQKWQWAAMQAGDRSEDFTKSLLAVQNAINGMVVNKSAPEFFGMIAKNMNKVGDFDPARFQKDSFYAMTKLQEAAQNMHKNMQGSLATYMLKSMGLGDTTIAAMFRGAFTPAMINKAPSYSEDQIRALDRANIAWANLGNKIELAFGRFNAAHGGELVRDINQITISVIKLTEALFKFAEKMKVFAFLSEGLEGIATGLSGITTVFDYFFGNKKDQEAASKNLGSFGSGLKYITQAGPKIPSGIYSSPKGNETNIDLNQTVIFQGHHEAPQRTVDVLKKQVGDYFKQSSAKTVGG